MSAVTSIVAAALVAAAFTRSLAAQAPDGQALFREHCKSCHGINGVPPERAVRDYAKIKILGTNGFVAALAEDSIVKILKKGIDKDMKSFAEKMSEPEMHAVAKYIKTLAESKKGGS